MKISIFCDSINHPVLSYLKRYVNEGSFGHEINLITCIDRLGGGDLLFLVSCSSIISKSTRELYKNCIVIHASNLPIGRGWSPHIWEIIGGAESITISAIEATDLVDSGAIWLKKRIKISRSSLWNEINHILFTAEIEIIDNLINLISKLSPKQQSADVESTYYRKRSPEDSELNVKKSIEDQFDLLRISDPYRYPAFFNIRGRKFKLIIEEYER
jgi:methionyl-tRNA formyltransferase